MSTFWLQHQLSIVVFLGIILAISLSNVYALKRLRRYGQPRHWPKVSILVPARNEAENITPCVQSLLEQDYPHFEILVLNDGSTDRTGEQLAALTAEDDHLQVLQGRPLPEGWLGKHWACQQLAEAATGELLFFTDADTRHSPTTLTHAIAVLLAEDADLLTALVGQELGTWGERLLVPVVLWSFVSFLPVALAHRLPWPALTLTNGQFMLFRRQAYEAVGGHRAVRADPVDDIALGHRIKARRLRWRLVDATELVRCRMYRGWREAVEGFSKNLFAAFGGRLLPYLFVWLWLAWVTFEPLVRGGLWVMGQSGGAAGAMLAGVAVAEMVALWGLSAIRFRLPAYLLLLYPASIAFFMLPALRSPWLALTKQAHWKGRALPQQRVRLL